LDEKNIFYINFLHHGQKISKLAGKEFLKKLLESDKKIIGHNLKYDLEIIENFLSSISEKEVKEKKTQTSLF